MDGCEFGFKVGSGVVVGHGLKNRRVLYCGCWCGSSCGTGEWMGGLDGGLERGTGTGDRRGGVQGIALRLLGRDTFG